MRSSLRWCAVVLVVGSVLIASTAVLSAETTPAKKGKSESAKTAETMAKWEQAVADDVKGQGGQEEIDPAKMAEMMGKWQKAATPGENHKHLDYFVGNWKTTTKVWMGGPGSPPMESGGTSSVKWVLNGRFVMDHHKGEFMGQPYEGMGLTGYDNYKNMYVGTWADNMSTHVLTMYGARDPSGKTFTYYGQMDEPMLDVFGRTVKYVTTIINDDRYKFEIYDLHAADDYKVLEITYNRQ
ncbi:MAG: DUF1579 domain-containing protein [Phycisphaerae bacterium]